MDYELGDNLSFVDDVQKHFTPQNMDAETKHNISKKQNHTKFAKQVEAIYQQHGSLEDMRTKLNISRKQICEYLMVDPSAWSRWIKGSHHDVPPHVFRTMALIMESDNNMREVRPSTELAPMSARTLPVSKGSLASVLPTRSVPDLPVSIANMQIQIREEYLSQIETLKEKLDATIKQNEKFEILKMGWKVILILNTVALLYVLFR